MWRIFFFDELEAELNVSVATRNSTYRGNSLGTIRNSTDANEFSRKHLISQGAFLNMYLGDYITIQDGTYNKDWLIAGFDSKMGNGNTSHHIILISKKYLTTTNMNDTSTGEGGYYSSKMNTTTLPSIANTLSNVLGGHMATHKIYMSNSLATSYPYRSNAGAYYDTKLALMTEVDVIGTNTYSNQYDDGGQTSILPIFNHITPGEYQSSTPYWLRPASGSSFLALISSKGTTGSYFANTNRGVRPCLMFI